MRQCLEDICSKPESFHEYTGTASLRACVLMLQSRNLHEAVEAKDGGAWLPGAGV